MAVQGIFNLKFLGPVSFAILIVGLLGSAGQAYAPFTHQHSWDGGGDGTSWSDPLNWSGNHTPATSSQITINPGTDVTVHLDIDFGPGSFYTYHWRWPHTDY